MDEWTDAARSRLDEYLARVRESLRGLDVDVEDVVDDVRGHVEAEASAGPGPVGREAVEDILARLGPPEEWAGVLPGEWPRGPRAPGPESLGRAGWMGWGVLGLTLAGVAAFPWVGPVLLLTAWVVARAVLARAESGGVAPRETVWLTAPAVGLNLLVLAVLVLLGPALPLAEIAGRWAPDAAPLVTLLGMVAWWGVVWAVARSFSGWLRALVRPLDRIVGDWRSMAVLGSALALAGPAALEAQTPEPLAGTWEIRATLGPDTMEGTILLWERDGGVGGQLRLGSLPPAEVTGARREGESVRVDLVFPEGAGEANWTVLPDSTIEGHIQVGPNRVPFTGGWVEDGGAVEDPASAIREEVRDRAPVLLREAGEPGLAVAVVGGQAPWVAGFGVADPATGREVSGATLFQLGSISKTLTAWGVMSLVEEGRVHLDQPVGEYLERWEFPDSDFDLQGVTVRRLLSHTAGVNVPSIGGVDLDETVPTLVEELEGRGDPERAVSVVAEPGAGYAYSGGGYMVLQLLVEEVTGRPFAEFMDERVLEPLGMREASFQWNPRVAQQVAVPTSTDPERDRRHRLFAGVAGAGLYASAGDMARFLAAHFPGPDGEPAGRGVVSPAAVETLMTADPVAGRYGLGYEVYPQIGGASIVGHGGSNVGWKANFILVPTLELGVVVMSNADEGRARAGVVELARDLILRALRP